MKTAAEILSEKGFIVYAHKGEKDIVQNVIITPLLEAMETYASQRDTEPKEEQPLEVVFEDGRKEYWLKGKRVNPQSKEVVKKEGKGAEEIDLIQYVTNLLYYAFSFNGPTKVTDEFDKWVEEKTNELSQYYASLPAKSVTDEDIDKKIFEICSRMRTWDGKSHPITAPEMMQELAKWIRDGQIPKK